MADESDDRREAITDLLQQQGPPKNDDVDIDAPNPEGSAICTGWVLVAEWMDETGERWISKGHAPSKAKWEADGMLHEALYGDWSG